MKIFTIGDSISQGFMSMSAARTDLSYSTIIARLMGIPDDDYKFPNWPLGGHPANLENILRGLNIRFGTNLMGFEWFGVLATIARGLDQVEDYYERGDGRADNPYDSNAVKFFHNAAIRGYSIADVFDVDSEFCLKKIDEAKKRFLNDGIMATPSASFARTALRVLNPSLQDKYMKFTILDWLKHHHHTEGVENLILWLGANNALGTILTLRIKQTNNDPNRRPFQIPYDEREEFNLWHPEDFRADYTELLVRTDAIMADTKGKAPDWKVFLATIPLITIAPLAKGVGETTTVTRKSDGKTCIYYKYYTYVPFTLEHAQKHPIKLNLPQAVHIDECIIEYNKIIKSLASDLNTKHGQERYCVVDIAKNLDEMAFKRNDSNIKYAFPEYFKFVYPMPNTKFYHATPNGDMEQGGIFSLDGVHPSAIGQGLIAWEFLKVMDKARGTNLASAMNWEEIFKSDTLYQKPISLMQEIYQHDGLKELMLDILDATRD